MGQRKSADCIAGRATVGYNRGMGADNAYRLDKTAVRVRKLSDPDDWSDYWKTKTTEERLRAIEAIRQMIYGYDPATTRLQRVARVTKREGR